MTEDYENIMNRLEKLEKCLVEDGGELKRTVDTLHGLVRGDPAKGQIGLEIIINGSTELKVEPMRDVVDRLSTAYDRLVWLAGILGISSIAGLIGWVLFFLNRGGLP